MKQSKRRQLLLGVPTLAGLPLITSLAAFANTTPKKQVIRVMLPANPYFELIKQFLIKLSANAGISLEIDTLPYLEMRNTQLIELQKKQGKYDLIFILTSWKAEYVALNLLSNLDAAQKNGSLKIDAISDFIPAYLTVAGKVGGERGYLDGPQANLYALPLGTDTSILGYRSDIFQKHNWKAPLNYDELLALLPLIRLHEPGLIPLASRGARGHQITHAWLLHFNAYGGEVFDKNWQVKVNSSAGVKAIEVLKAIHLNTAGGILKNTFPDVGNAFISGNAAMYLDSSFIFNIVNDTVKSVVQDKVAYALHPKGTIYSSETGGFAVAVPKNAPSLKRSLELLSVLTSRAQEKAFARIGGIPVRSSTLHDPELQKIFPEYAILAKQLDYANPNWRPVIPEWPIINEDILGNLLHDAVAGKITATQALEQAQEKIRLVMQASARYKKRV
ncbi:extracellular solute-binding protein [Undibacterium parvum]|uniref:Extracellular solute-binding protein n=1 Tax=Undibacterium parvum TaxID=401471 RepID=A0A3Q9BSA9_9BURK|nr:extracellular solute-binding protein [Undibacterium parvum]AZP13397.1 extracellular solute-binding protein [Undibacterium parvum]